MLRKQELLEESGRGGSDQTCALERSTLTTAWKRMGGEEDCRQSQRLGGGEQLESVCIMTMAQKERQQQNEE